MAVAKRVKATVVERKRSRKQPAAKVEAAKEPVVEVDPCSSCERKCSAEALDGKNSLRRSACRQVKQEADEIALSLCNGAKKGSLRCAQILLSLAEAQMEKTQARKPENYRTAAMDLAEEEEWIEQVTGVYAERVEGGLEQEN